MWGHFKIEEMKVSPPPKPAPVLPPPTKENPKPQPVSPAPPKAPAPTCLPSSNNHYAIKSLTASKCLSAGSNNSTIALVNCGLSSNKLWKVVPGKGNFTYFITHRKTGGNLNPTKTGGNLSKDPFEWKTKIIDGVFVPIKLSKDDCLAVVNLALILVKCDPNAPNQLFQWYVINSDIDNLKGDSTPLAVKLQADIIRAKPPCILNNTTANVSDI